MRRNWSLRPEMLDGSVPPEVLARVSDFSPLIDAGECVERTATATTPLTLLVMTDRYLHTVTARGTHEWADGAPRSSLTARAEGEDLVVLVADEERRFGSVLPAGAAGRFADELYKPFTSRTPGKLRAERRRSPTSPGRRFDLSLTAAVLPALAGEREEAPALSRVAN